MAKLKDQNINQNKLSKISYSLFDFSKKEKPFLIIICILVAIAGYITQYTYAAMWFGFGSLLCYCQRQYTDNWHLYRLKLQNEMVLAVAFYGANFCGYGHL